MVYVKFDLATLLFLLESLYIHSVKTIKILYTLGFEVGESNQKLKISIFNTSFNKKQKSIIGNIVNLRKNNFQSTSLCKKCIIM